MPSELSQSFRHLDPALGIGVCPPEWLSRLRIGLDVLSNLRQHDVNLFGPAGLCDQIGKKTDEVGAGVTSGGLAVDATCLQQRWSGSAGRLSSHLAGCYRSGPLKNHCQYDSSPAPIL